MRLFLALLFTCFSFVSVLAQPLAAYVDIQNQFMVWDRGMIRKADYLAPVSVKTGRIAIAYLDNVRSFKIYTGGGVREVNNGFTNAFFVTDNIIAYLNQKSLNVLDRGVTKNLTGVCDQYFIGDSVVMFLDTYKGEYRAYYNNKLYTVETFIPDSVLSHIRVSDNIIAYDNFASLFRIFYHGTIIAQEDYPVATFEVGRNTVAYVDIDRKFKVFHSGQTFVLDDFPPKSFQVGDNQVGFVTSDGYFKIFYGDSVRNMGYMNTPYQVGDNVIGYKDPSGIFKVFYKGEVTDLDNFYPANYTIQYNSIAYINSGNTLRVFTEGEAFDVTSAELTSWQLNYDVITYQIGQGIFKVFYKGQEY